MAQLWGSAFSLQPAFEPALLVQMVDIYPLIGGLVYTMAMNIKNPETERLVRELAAITHENMTDAITHAVRDRLEALRRQRGSELADRLLAIGKDCAPRLKEPFRSAEHGDLLYDERGLPR
jgi:antitoxin VapB